MRSCVFVYVFSCARALLFPFLTAPPNDPPLPPTSCKNITKTTEKPEIKQKPGKAPALAGHAFNVPALAPLLYSTLADTKDPQTATCAAILKPYLREKPTSDFVRDVIRHAIDNQSTTNQVGYLPVLLDQMRALGHACGYETCNKQQQWTILVHQEEAKWRRAQQAAKDRERTDFPIWDVKVSAALAKEALAEFDDSTKFVKAV